MPSVWGLIFLTSSRVSAPSGNSKPNTSKIGNRRMIHQPKLHELSWLGGLVDGEGTICLSADGDKYAPLFQIPNTNRLLIETAKKIFHNNGLYNVPVREMGSKVGYKQMHILYLYVHQDILFALTLIQEYLIGKRTQCLLLKEYIGLRASKKRGMKNP